MPYQWTGYMNADGTKQMQWVGGTDTPGDAVPFQNPDTNIAVQNASNEAINRAAAGSQGWNNYWDAQGNAIAANRGETLQVDPNAAMSAKAQKLGLQMRSKNADKSGVYLWDPKTGKEYVEPKTNADGTVAGTPGKTNATGGPMWDFSTPTQSQAAAKDLTSTIGNKNKPANTKKWNWKVGR
jgi:hypothetical protein